MTLPDVSPVVVDEQLKRLKREKRDSSQPQIEFDDLDEVPEGYWDRLDEALRKMPFIERSDVDFEVGS